MVEHFLTATLRVRGSVFRKLKITTLNVFKKNSLLLFYWEFHELKSALQVILRLKAEFKALCFSLLKLFRLLFFVFSKLDGFEPFPSFVKEETYLL